MKIASTLLSAIALAAASEYVVPVSNDVGLIYSSISCGVGPCYQTNLYGEPDYTAFFGNRDLRRILMGFSLGNDVDPSSITSCKLQLPQPVTPQNSNPSTYTLSVSQVNAEYDAKTVTPAKAPSSGSPIVEATLSDRVVPPAMDVTTACTNAVNGNVNLMLDARGAPVTFSSSASSNSAKLIVSTK